MMAQVHAHGPDEIDWWLYRVVDLTARPKHFDCSLVAEVNMDAIPEATSRECTSWLSRSLEGY